MAKAPNEEAKKLLDEGGKPLEDALKASLAAAEGTAEEPEEAPEEKAEPEPESEEESEEEAGEAEDEKADDKKEADKSEDEPDKSKEDPADAEDADRSSGKPKSKVGKKIEKLLSQRNSARIAAEAAEKRAAEAERKLAERKAEGKAEEDETPDENDSIETLVKKQVEEVLAGKEVSTRKADSDKQEREVLLSKYPEAKNFVKEIDKVLAAHPDLSDEFIYRGLNPSDFVKSKEDARKLESRGRTPASLLTNKKPSQMSTKELEDAVRAMAEKDELPV